MREIVISAPGWSQGPEDYISRMGFTFETQRVMGRARTMDVSVGAGGGGGAPNGARITEDSGVRITEDGGTRLIE